MIAGERHIKKAINKFIIDKYVMIFP